MQEVTMYPTKVSQPNRNKDSGLQGKCFEAVTRSGGTYSISCQDQRDPKYHHEWSNAEEILKGKTIQCGRPSTHMCSHATYYGIAGYRNTCPIAGVTGTYTQPATLRVKFDLSKKGISSHAIISEVKISFDHRCTGVDVANGKESFSWGPNFDGAKRYPNHKPLKVKIGNKTVVYDKNPPLGKAFSNTGDFVFKNVSYKDLVENGVDIIYGNNLETNPGNIYVKNLKAKIKYTDGVPYIEGKQNKNSLYISPTAGCRSKIKFTLEAGYKSGETKIPPNKAVKKIRANNIEAITEDKNNITVTLEDKSPDDGKTIIAVLEDKTNIEGKKRVTFKIKNTKTKITFKYKAKKRPKPDIEIPRYVERNTKKENVTGIIAKDGCCSKIEVYDNNLLGTPFYTFSSDAFDLTNTENIIIESKRKSFYEALSQLACGDHIIYFRRDGESDEETIFKYTTITPTVYNFKITEKNSTENLLPKGNYTITQNKQQNHVLEIEYVERADVIKPPVFTIVNPTYGKEENGAPTHKKMDNIDEWNTDSTSTNTYKGPKIDFSVGTYHSGTFDIKIQETLCPQTPTIFRVVIPANHRQYYDEIFVRGEDSTAFDYDYLVAFEGDTVAEPIYVETIHLDSSFNDIKICTTPSTITGLAQMNTFDLTITNNQQNDIENLLLELNTLIKDEDNNYQVTSNEWLESSGIFFNFKENFENYNTEFEDYVQIKNLTPDDDKVDEEDVYIHVLKIKAGQTISLKIPYMASTPKTVYLQVLLFEQPLKLYNTLDCTNESLCFDLISVQVFDSMLTNMFIEGKTDLFEDDIEADCPEEYFHTQIKYRIENIDTITVRSQVKTVIHNDPRLIPYKIEYDGKEYNPNKLPSNIVIDKNDTAYKPPIIMDREKVSLYTKFDGYDEKEYYKYTDSNGEIVFFIEIPLTLGGEYTTEDILNFCSIEYEGTPYYNGFVLQQENSNGTSKYNGTMRNYPEYTRKGHSKIDAIKTPLTYRAGQTIPIRIKLYGIQTYIKNDIIFYPNIHYSHDSDNFIVHYRIYNLENNRGKLKTTFETDDYHLVPNKKEKTIYCGVDTKLSLKTKLTKVLVENKTINRLYISVINEERDNKDIIIKIIEEEDIEKYIVSTYNSEAGIIYPRKNYIFNPDFDEGLRRWLSSRDSEENSIIFTRKDCKHDSFITFSPFTTADITQEDIDFTNIDSISFYAKSKNNDELQVKIFRYEEDASINRTYTLTDDWVKYTIDTTSIADNKYKLSFLVENSSSTDSASVDLKNITYTTNTREDLIVWKIQYMEENSIINGYIDFIADKVGYSKLKTSAIDFLIDEETGEKKYKFGKDSYKCPDCRE